MSYETVECPDCEGWGASYKDFCHVCEQPCEHDGNCRKCRGWGLIVRRGWSGFLGKLMISEGSAYRTRAEAMAEREGCSVSWIRQMAAIKRDDWIKKRMQQVREQNKQEVR